MQRGLLAPTQVCTETYGAAPDVIIHRGDAADITMPYVDSHLDYMLFELMKNAMRAIVESSRRRASQNRVGGNAALPPVHVHICKAPTSVTLRISDQVGSCVQRLRCLWSHMQQAFCVLCALPHCMVCAGQLERNPNALLLEWQCFGAGLQVRHVTNMALDHKRLLRLNLTFCVDGDLSVAGRRHPCGSAGQSVPVRLHNRAAGRGRHLGAPLSFLQCKLLILYTCMQLFVGNLVHAEECAEGAG